MNDSRVVIYDEDNNTPMTCFSTAVVPYVPRIGEKFLRECNNILSKMSFRNTSQIVDVA